MKQSRSHSWTASPRFCTWESGLGEAAWHARHRPWLNKRLKRFLPTLPAGVSEIAWKAQARGSSRRMKDCAVRRYDKPSNISLITVDKACHRPFTLRFISIADGGNT
jgi:hypothetical protein